MKQVDTSKATVNIFLEADGEIYLVAFEKEKLEAISFLVKNSIHHLAITNRTQAELNKFVGWKGGK